MTLVSLFRREDQRQLGYYDFMGKMSDEGKKYFKESVSRTPVACMHTPS